MILWLQRYFALTIRQLPILWFVLTISPNLSPERSVWVLIIVFVLLYASVSLFEILFDSKGTEENKKYSFWVWLLAAGLYGLAANFSSLKVSLLFLTLVAFYGAISLVIKFFLQNRNQLTSFGNAVLEGVFSFVVIYVGINDFGLANVLKWSILVPGIVATLVLFAIDLTKNQSVVSGRYIFALTLFTASSVTIILYFNTYLNVESLWAVAMIVIGLIALHFLLPLLKQRHQRLVTSMPALFWIYVVILNGCFFFLFTEYTHILQLV